MKASVIVPVLYSEPRLRETLERLLALRHQVDMEILVVVDVPDLAREREAKEANEPIIGETEAVAMYRLGERGFGSALREGFAKAGGDVLVPFMGDASDDPDEIPRFVDEIHKGADVVAGSRYMAGGHIVGNTPKQMISRLYSFLARFLGGIPIHDVSNSFKAYRRLVVESIETIATSFDISVELTVKAWHEGFDLREVPTVWTNRQEGRSHFVMAREVQNYGRWLFLAIRTRLSGGGRHDREGRK